MNLLSGKIFKHINILRRHSTRIYFSSIIAPFIPLNKKRVAIVVNHRVPLSGNLKIVADELLNRGKAEVLIYKDGPVPKKTIDTLEQAGAIVLTKFSIRNLISLLQSSTIIMGHGVGDAYIKHARKGRRIINLWHGVTLKKIELLVGNKGISQDAQDKSTRRAQEDGALYDYMIASNPHDKRIMAQAFNMPLEKVLDCGLPRFDYLRDPTSFSTDMVADSDHFLEKVKTQKIIAYTPTFRETAPSPLSEIKGETLDGLRTFCEKYDCKIAIRPHPYDLAALDALLSRIDGDFILDASSRIYSEPAILLQHADMLITDYSSIWVDYLFTERPIFALVPDLEHYISNERGFINDFRSLLPGPICKSWDAVLTEMALRINCQQSAQARASEQTRRNLANERLLPSDDKNSYTDKLLEILAEEDALFTRSN